MKSTKRKKTVPLELQNRLTELETRAAQKGICIHYDLLEAGGLKLKGGLCKIKGQYHLFVDRRKSIADKIDFIEDYMENPLPEDIPEGEMFSYQASPKG